MKKSILILFVLLVTVSVVFTQTKTLPLRLSKPASVEFLEHERVKAELNAQYALLQAKFEAEQARENLLLADNGFKSEDRARRWTNENGVITFWPDPTPAATPTPALAPRQ